MLLLSTPPCLPAGRYICLSHVSHIFLASFLTLITSRTSPFHHQVSLSSGYLHPAVILNTSCHTLKIVVLLSSHHSCTLSTGLTFSNTASLNFSLGFSSFSHHHVILGIACSDVQGFSLLYSSLCVNLGIPLQSRFHHPGSHSALDHYLTKTFVFHSLYNQLVEHKRTWCWSPSLLILARYASLEPSSCSHWSGLPSVLCIVLSPHHSTLSRLHHYGATCSFSQLFRFVALPSIVRWLSATFEDYCYSPDKSANFCTKLP